MAVAQAKLRWGSLTLLTLAFVGWVMALGGLGAITWFVCSDTQSTRTDIATAEGPAAMMTYMQFSMPAAPTDVAVCSRSWRFEWWTLFFTLFAITYGVASTLLPNRLPRARFAVSQYLVIALLLVMVSLNDNLSDVWHFWDTPGKRLFSAWSGAVKKLYMAAAALCSGWIILAIFSFIYIGFALDCTIEETKPAAAAAGADVEAPHATKK